jgi:DNA-directed RNA polymerase subunit RPC12/RpoP
MLTATIQSYATLENTTCKKCHPTIFAEYQNSIHSKSSIFKDAVHKAVWDKHPAKPKNNYKCAKCHTPSDHDLISGKSKLADNEIQQNEPISCQACHTIESVEKHTKANKN